MTVREAVSRITVHAKAGKDAFERSGQVQADVRRAIEQIGQAVGGFSRSFMRRYAAVDWNRVQGMAAMASCRAQSVDPETVWLVVEQDIPRLVEIMRELFASVDTQCDVL